MPHAAFAKEDIVIVGYRVLLPLLTVGLFSFTACTNPATAVNARPSAMPPPLDMDPGISLGGLPRLIVNSDATRPRAAAPASAILPVADVAAEAHAVGVVNSVNPVQKRINLSHGPIPAIGWPAMTMDFPVLPSVDLSGVKPGDKIDATIQKGKSGSYEIRSFQPAAR